MGQARTRKLSIVKDAIAGNPIVIELGPKTNKRLSELWLLSRGAKMAAEAAVNAANGTFAEYQRAIRERLEADDIEVTERSKIDHNLEKGTITFSTIPSEETG